MNFKKLKYRATKADGVMYIPYKIHLVNSIVDYIVIIYSDDNICYAINRQNISSNEYMKSIGYKYSKRVTEIIL